MEASAPQPNNPHPTQQQAGRRTDQPYVIRHVHTGTPAERFRARVNATKRILAWLEARGEL